MITLYYTPKNQNIVIGQPYHGLQELALWEFWVAEVQSGVAGLPFCD